MKIPNFKVVNYHPAKLVLYLLAMAVLMIGGSYASDLSNTGVIVRTALIKSFPSFGANTLHTATVGQSAELGERQGGWQKIKVLPGKKIQGWVRVYQIRTDIEPEEIVVERRSTETETLSGLSGLSRRTASLFGRREISGKSSQSLTAAMGVRGLSEADLKNAKPDIDELENFKIYATTASVAKGFAAEVGLKSSKIKSLPKPKKKKKKKKDKSR